MPKKMHDADQTFETVIDKTGWGLYYRFLVGLCCFAQFAIALTHTAIVLILPLAYCDIHFGQKEMLKCHAIYILGAAFGTYINGCSFDLYGRKTLITSFTVFIFCGCFSAAFATNSALFDTCIFLIGFSVETCRIALKIYMAENMPRNFRGCGIILQDIFWTCGCIISFALSMAYTSILIVPPTPNDIRLNSWRIMMALCGVLPMIVSCSTALLFASPRFLLMKKLFGDAKELLQHIYAINFSTHADNWPTAPEVEVIGLIKPQAFENTSRPLTCWESLIRCLYRMHILTVGLFNFQLLRTTIICLVLKTILFPGTIMMSFWLLAILNDTHTKNDTETYARRSFISSECQLQAIQTVFITREKVVNVTSHRSQCYIQVDSDFVVNATILYLFVLVGQFLVYLLVERLGRRVIAILSFFGCTILMVMFLFWINYWVRLLLSTIYLSCFAMANSILDVVIIESYPTRSRGTAIGFISFPAYLIAAIVQIHLVTSCVIFFIMFGLFFFLGSSLATLLPERQRQPMLE